MKSIRSTVFFYITGAGVFSELITTSLTSLLMDIDVWLPSILSLACGTFVILVAAFALPETLPLVTIDPHTVSIPSKKGLQLWERIMENFKVLFLDKAVAALVAGFLVLRLGRQSLAISLQYVSRKYDWSLSEVRLASKSSSLLCK